MEALRSLCIAHDAYSHHAQYLHSGYSLHNFLLVHLGSQPISFPHSMSQASLGAQESCEENRLGGVVLGEFYLLAMPAAMPLTGSSGTHVWDQRISCEISCCQVHWWISNTLFWENLEFMSYLVDQTATFRDT